MRLHYAYPSACGDELLDVIASEPRVAKYLDVPLQHIDSDVLKKMRRGYGERVVRELVERARARIPGVTLRTTFIVGHPGESDAAFRRLCDFVPRPSSITSASSPTRKRRAPPRRCCPGASPAARPTPAAASCCASSARSRRRSCARCAAASSRSWSRARPTSREYLLMGRHEGQAPEIDGQVYLTLDDASPANAAPTPGTLLRARVTHSAEYDLAATVVA